MKKLYKSFCPRCKKENESKRETGISRVAFKCSDCRTTWTMERRHTLDEKDEEIIL
jgi:transposase-like protein